MTTTAQQVTPPDFEVYSGSDPYCFVSYSHANAHDVYTVLNTLADHRFRLWYDDSMEIGDDFRKELRERIAACDAFILFVSEESMGSKYCGMEIITAHQLGKRIYPVQLYEETVIPAPLRLILDNLQHVKAHTGERRYVQKLIESLPPETMHRLLIEDGVVQECADHGKEIVIPDGVRAVGPRAFKECLQLQRVVFPDSLEELGDEAFRGCASLREIHLGENISHVGHSAFRDCVRLERLEIENPNVVLAGRCFENCQALESVTLSPETEEIFEATFNSCRSLKTFDVPPAVRIIGESAFADCTGIGELVLPDGVIKIDAGAFCECSSLASIHLPPKLSKIGRYAFKGCSQLEQVEIPEGVSTLDGDAFRECVNLRQIDVQPASRFFKSVDGVLFNKNRSTIVAYPSARPATEYDVPDSVTLVSEWAFCQADNLRAVTIPDTVEEIGEGAFFSTSHLEQVVLPNSLERIDDIAFRGCASLRRVEVPSHVWHVGWGAFLDCPELEVICEPASVAWKHCEEYGVPHRAP